MVLFVFSRMIAVLLAGLLFKSAGYYLLLLWFSFSTAYFLVSIDKSLNDFISAHPLLCEKYHNFCRCNHFIYHSWQLVGHPFFFFFFFFFFTKNLFKLACILYTICRFKICNYCKSAEISYLATPNRLDFRETFIYLLSLFKKLLCRLKVLSLIILY